MTKLATLIYDNQCRLFDKMQELGYDRTSGEDALHEEAEFGLADFQPRETSRVEET